MKATTGTTGSSTVFTAADIDRVKKQMEKIIGEAKTKGQFILITPDGKMFKGDIATVMSGAMQYHPLFKGVVF